MSPLSRLTGFIVLLGGFGSLAWGLLHWQSADFGLFLGYLTVATAAASLRIRLPSVSGALSLHFFFVLICITRLSLPETLVIAGAGAVLQCMLFMKAPVRWFGVAFEIAVSVASATAAYLTYYTLADGAAVRSPLLLLLAGSVFFVMHSAPAALITALEEKRNFGKLWRECYFWTFPHYLAGGGAAGLLLLLEQRTGWETVLLILPVTYWMYHSYRYYLQRFDEERRQLRDLSSLHFRTIEALALAIEGHDPTKHGHLRRVSIYVTELGRQLKLPKPEQQALLAAAMLHDIGKLAVPEHIITKPGRLTEVEFERIKIHPEAGAEILEQVQFPYPVAPIVRAHHEKWDGTGYPAGLKGEAIPMGARILSAVDCLDALLSDRYHRRALGLEQAIEHVQSESGRSFDPAVVEILVAQYQELEAQVQAALQQSAPAVLKGSAQARLEAGSRAPAGAAAGTTFLTRIAAARKEEQLLFQLARELGNSLSLDETLAVCALRIKSICPYDSIAIYIHRDDMLVAEYASGESAWNFGSLEIPVGEGLSGWVAENHAPILNGDPAVELTVQGVAAPEGLESALVVPLEGLSGVVGVLALYAQGKDAFTADQLRMLLAASTKAALSVENAIKYSQAERSATTDVLTSLPNARSLFLHLDAELARARRQNTTISVLVCDLDGFKQVNDRFGHMEGNRLLRAVAQALKRQCREYDFVARMGGDEFVVVLPGYRTASVLAKIEQLCEIAELAGYETLGTRAVGLSVGDASYPADGNDAESILAEADRRMYQMKQQRAARDTDPSSAQLRRLRATLEPGTIVQ